jgi:hypothetical protein
MDGDVAKLGDEPVAVQWVTEYRTTDGVFVGNCECQTKGTHAMTESQMIDALIANGVYSEADKAWLTKTPAAGLAVMFRKIPAGNVNPPGPAALTVANANQPSPAELSAALTNANLDPRYKAVLDNLVAREEAEKQQMIANIMSHPVGKQRFTAEYLNTLPIGTVQSIQDIGSYNATPVQQSRNGVAPPSYTGQAVSTAVANTDDNDDAPPHLVAPACTVAPKKKK